ncbi:MAG: DinB family protein [Spirochaetes bacterium]|nr:DinB family protein [Spirochaetota bacterium]
MNYSEITNKEKLIAKYSSDYSRLKSIIKELPEDAADFMPDIKDAWSIREHYAHLMDAEIRAFLRYTNSILNPGIKLEIGGGDVNTSNKLLKYSTRNIKESLEVIRLLRSIILQHVTEMRDEDMTEYTIQHPDFGRINLKMILSIYTQHVDFHIEYIQRNIDLYLKQKINSQ